MIHIQRVYVDTSVIGGCIDSEFKQYSMQLMTEFKIGTLQAVVSSLTSREVARAPAEVQNVYRELLDTGAELIPVPDEAVELADKYIDSGILSPNYRNDAVHIATATVCGLDMLLSWNFKHIVHYDKIRLFNGINLELGYKLIEIHSPMEVVSYDN
jgi:predicted nucleic acid-binding protein